MGDPPPFMPCFAKLQKVLVSMRFRRALGALLGIPAVGMEPLMLRSYQHSESHHFTAPHTDQHQDIIMNRTGGKRFGNQDSRIVWSLASLSFNLGSNEPVGKWGGLVWCSPSPRRLPSPTGSALAFRISNLSWHTVVPGYGDSKGKRLTIQVVFGGSLPGGPARPPAFAVDRINHHSANLVSSGADAPCEDDDLRMQEISLQQLGHALGCQDFIHIDENAGLQHCKEGGQLAHFCCSSCRAFWTMRGQIVSALAPQQAQVRAMLKYANENFRTPELHGISGMRMPLLAFGTGQLSGRRAEQIIEYALRSGYRHLDSALSYPSHGWSLKLGVARSEVARSEIFLTTKIPPSSMGYEAASAAVASMAQELPGGYADLCLVHWPFVNGVAKAELVVVERAGTWRALEAAYNARICRAIGVSNYFVKHLEELEGYARIRPAVNQIEYSPSAPLLDLVEYCRRKGIVIEAFNWHPAHVLELPPLVKVASDVGRSVVQVLVRWFVAQGMVPLFRTEREERILGNALAVSSDFDLTELQIASITEPRDDYPWGYYKGDASPVKIPAMKAFA